MALRLWPFARRTNAGAAIGDKWALDAEVFRWAAGCPCSVAQTLENILIMGGTGSGKTSSAGRKIATAYLAGGYGGLVLTSKPDDLELWRRYGDETGRSADVCVIEPGGLHRYNVLASELRHQHPAGATHNLVSILTTVMEKAQGGDGARGSNENKFWEDGAREVLTNAIDLLLLATSSVSVPDLHRVVLSAPPSPEAVRSQAWRSDSLCFQLLTRAERNNPSGSRLEDLRLATDYWLLVFPGLNARTRNIFVAIVLTMLGTLNRGVARDLFSADTTIDPAGAAADGKVVIVNLPVLQFREIGTLCQILVKTAFQRAILRRDVRTNPRPVFLWSDEFQTLATSMDGEFLAVCRSARVSCVALTQNLPNVRAAMGAGSAGEARADGLFGNFNTKVFLANACPVTNEWASSIAGRSVHFLSNGSAQAPADWVSSAFGLANQTGASAGFSESYELDVQPAVFTKLRTGGPVNGWTVDAILVQSGRVFPDTGTIWRPVRFLQKP